MRVYPMSLKLMSNRYRIWRHMITWHDCPIRYHHAHLWSGADVYSELIQSRNNIFFGHPKIRTELSRKSLVIGVGVPHDSKRCRKSNRVFHPNGPVNWNTLLSRDYFVYVPKQWETTLQCNVIFHWLGTYTKRFPHFNKYFFFVLNVCD